MPYEIDWESDGVVVRFLGTFDLNSNTDAAAEIYEYPRSQDINYAIWDTSVIDEVHFTEGATNILSMMDQMGSSRIPNIKMAFYATDRNARGVCEQYLSHYQTRQTGWQFMVSDDMKSIRSWIAS